MKEKPSATTPVSTNDNENNPAWMGAIVGIVFFVGVPLGLAGLYGFSMIDGSMAAIIAEVSAMLSPFIGFGARTIFKRLGLQNKNASGAVMGAFLATGGLSGLISLIVCFATSPGNQQTSAASLAPFLSTWAVSIVAIALLSCALIAYCYRDKTPDSTGPMITDGSKATSASEAGAASTPQSSFQPAPDPRSVPLPVASPPPYAAPPQSGQPFSATSATAASASLQPNHSTSTYPQFSYGQGTQADAPPPSYEAAVKS